MGLYDFLLSRLNGLQIPVYLPFLRLGNWKYHWLFPQLLETLSQHTQIINNNNWLKLCVEEKRMFSPKAVKWK